MNTKLYTYLALGDAYTAGVSVSPAESFPYQAVQLLRSRHPAFGAPEILAGRGWTTEELTTRIEKARFLAGYDFVSLQIGVNNQSRGHTTDEFSMHFEALLLHAIRLAGNRTEKVIVLSIPDWSATPYGKGLLASRPDTAAVPARIDEYNRRKQDLCARYEVQFQDVTSALREQRDNAALHSEDGLHPSGVAYRRWAESLVEFMEDNILRDKHLVEN
jgi:lysophospholipase L1-like esterase